MNLKKLLRLFVLGKQLHMSVRSRVYQKLHCYINTLTNCRLEKNVGPAPVLNNNEEAEIVKWMMYCSQRGFPVTKSQPLTNVQLLIKKLARDIPFKDGRPGRHWYESFLRRHQEFHKI